ncbi:hypothetical protein J8F10_28405 [Gemmata sp. G18]|uniref:Integral membrane protein n=1 Tax=Gemmata palustris TaxID=2822762 RepID=A0ABS5BZN3_9BACT|nr:hypothetical protein [Gemmata palustris]MBP3959185.1 hypothetical protein [Gemmata palustris]
MSPTFARVCALAFCLAFVSTASADPMGEAEARRQEELARQAEEHRANGRLAARAFCVVIGGVILWVAVGIARNGLGFGSGLRRTTGPVAWVVAAVIGAAGLVIAVGGQVYAPDLLVRP